MDSSWYLFGVSAEVSALVAEKGFGLLKAKIKRLGLPDAPVPTSPGLSKYYYTSLADIAEAIQEVLGVSLDIKATALSDFVADVPDEYFKGPF